MTAYKKIKLHEKCISTLEALQQFEKRLLYCKGVFKEYDTKDYWHHKIEINQKCVNRLKLRYANQLREVIGIRIDEH